MNVSKSTLTLVFIGLVATLIAQATELGDVAPPLAIDAWVKGEAETIAAGKGKKIFVVEFWATWCPPCITSIPHLSELQKKYKDKDVVFIGISTEAIDTIEPFVEKMGDKMAYTVAMDKNQETYKAYMTAFKQGGIPHAFIVDKSGRIVWHGHPMADLEQTLDKIVGGTFDLEAAIAAGGNEAKTKALFKELIALCTEGTDHAKADDVGETLLKLTTNSSLLNMLAWDLMTDPDLSYRAPEVALAAAKSANKESGGEDPAILDTYALAVYNDGKLKKAIKLQRKAIALTTPEAAGPLQETLDKYLHEAGQ